MRDQPASTGEGVLWLKRPIKFLLRSILPHPYE